MFVKGLVQWGIQVGNGAKVILKWLSPGQSPQGRQGWTSSVLGLWWAQCLSAKRGLGPAKVTQECASGQTSHLNNTGSITTDCNHIVPNMIGRSPGLGWLEPKRTFLCQERYVCLSLFQGPQLFLLTKSILSPSSSRCEYPDIFPWWLLPWAWAQSALKAQCG